MRLSTNQRIILGPPGCGKTTKLLSLVEDEMAAGVSPRRIAYVSFTKKAVRESRERAAEKFNFEPDELVHFRTVHASSFQNSGFKRQDVFSAEHLKELGTRLGVEFGGGRWDDTTGTYSGNSEGDTHLFVDALARARCVSLHEQWEACGIDDLDFRVVERTVTAARNFKKIHGLLDYTDMLERYAEHGKPLDVEVAFIDEAQDLSRLQWKVLMRMFSTADRIYIAGDDDQAIYRWSGADVAAFLSLEGEQTVLHQSWRCPQAVHRVSNAISSQIKKRFQKQWKPKDEVGKVTRVYSLDQFDIKALEGSVMLLARNTYLLSNYYEELKKQGLAYSTSYGATSVSANHVRAILAWEILRKGKFIEADDARLVYDQLRVGVGVQRGFKGLTQLTGTGRVNLEMLKLLYGFIGPVAPWFDVFDAMAVKDVAYYRSILRAGGSLTTPPRVHVNTIHGVKGGEADNVIVCPDMAAKSFKEYQFAPDDEHRVAYVGVSRARKNLYILEPNTNNAYNYQLK